VQKEDAIEAWATQLLRVRDGKTRGLRAKGVLIALGKELIRAAKEEGGYPDSDDSDDEDDRTSKASTTFEVEAANGTIGSGNRERMDSRATDGTELRKSERRAKRVPKPVVFHRHKFDVFTK
jgi:hypothetical protein